YWVSQMWCGLAVSPAEGGTPRTLTPPYGQAPYGQVVRAERAETFTPLEMTLPLYKKDKSRLGGNKRQPDTDISNGAGKDTEHNPLIR
ncbi:MAG: hypothetical protein QME51_06110, partial [Planctomycetota bacterium]|nr:hypothetical protein [Planctomycetota bacterium]